MNTSVEYLIVGQGLAGSLIAQELIDAGKSILVVDPGHSSASSNIAAGIINPITGRRFVKSWRIAELLPFAKKRFRELEKVLNCEGIFKERDIIRILFSAGEENEWLSRTSQDGWKEFVGNDIGGDDFDPFIFPGFGKATLKGAQIDMPLFINAYRTFLRQSDRLIEEAFKFEIDKAGIRNFKGIAYDKIIFCEGANARFNPLWSAIEFEPAKGEIFHLKIPGLSTNKLLKHKMMLAPLGEDLFWFGANYEWNADDDQSSEIGRKFLTKRLNVMIRNYKEVGHFAAIRPTIKDRRPVMGQHPEWRHCYIFNGLGTKGASLGPLLAKEFIANLLNKEPLSPEIRAERFFKG